MTKEEALDKSEAHWKNMINWAGKQDGEKGVDEWAMDRSIGESWQGVDCALCDEYADINGLKCKECPLTKIGEGCDLKNSPWRKVCLSVTWSEWLINARKMLEVLKSLK